MFGWIVIAVAFAVVWIYALYREDIRNPEPLWLITAATLAGMIAVPVALFFEGRLTPDLSVLDGSLAERARVAFLVAGPVEESAKFVAIALLIWFQRNFDEPMDGIVYGTAAAAGFALVENIGFLRQEPASILARGPAATGVHILFAAFWGGALGHAKQSDHFGRRLTIVGFGLLLAFAAHGMFDMTTWSVGKELSLNAARFYQAALIIACALFLRWRIRVALRTVPAIIPREAVTTFKANPSTLVPVGPVGDDDGSA